MGETARQHDAGGGDARAVGSVPVRDRDGELLGHIDEVFTDEQGRTRFLAIDSGWQGGERVLLPGSLLAVDPDGELRSEADRERVATAPRIRRGQALTIDLTADVEEHYGLPGIDDEIAARQATPAPTPEIAKADLADRRREGPAGR